MNLLLRTHLIDGLAIAYLGLGFIDHRLGITNHGPVYPSRPVPLIDKFPLCYPSNHRSAKPAHAFVAHTVPPSRPTCIATGFVNQIVAIQTHVCLGIVTQIDMVMLCPYS